MCIRDRLIGGDYKLLLEPIAYVTFEGVRTAFTATEAAMYKLCLLYTSTGRETKGKAESKKGKRRVKSDSGGREPPARRRRGRRVTGNAVSYTHLITAVRLLQSIRLWSRNAMKARQ